MDAQTTLMQYHTKQLEKSSKEEIGELPEYGQDYWYSGIKSTIYASFAFLCFALSSACWINGWLEGRADEKQEKLRFVEKRLGAEEKEW
ncbi:MAG: hypothetical protein QME59_05155 [Candidatus Hydrothermarchaeota archaeon]|nr:hypothetical protein [Candidatus Hydrothermarchaeota archaeon]